MENAGRHTSKDIEKPGNILFWHIPPHAPELNPEEHLWEYIREN